MIRNIVSKSDIRSIRGGKHCWYRVYHDRGGGGQELQFAVQVVINNGGTVTDGGTTSKSPRVNPEQVAPKLHTTPSKPNLSSAEGRTIQNFPPLKAYQVY